MTMQYPAPEVAPQPPSKPTKKKHRLRNGILIGVGVFVGLGIVAGALSSGKTPASSAGEQGGTTPSTTAQTSAPPPAPTPSPNGTYTQGSCSYDLGSDPVNGTAVATGDVTVKNTGNIGTVIRVRFTWPQEGFSPLVSVHKIRLAAGATTDVQFNHPLTSNEVDALQNYQLGHSDLGCTDNAAIINTYGSVTGG